MTYIKKSPERILDGHGSPGVSQVIVRYCDKLNIAVSSTASRGH